MAKYIVGGAGTGKTKELLEYAKSINAVVVCANPEAMRVKAQNYGLHRMEFYGYDEINDLHEGRNVVVEELGDFFRFGLNLKLDGFNLTED